VTGTSINMILALDGSKDGQVYLLHRDNVRSAVFGVAFGGFSTILALLFILTHYNLVDCCWTFLTEGGWVELAAILLLILLWIVGTAVLTQYGGLAATIIGSGADVVQQQQQRSNPISPPPQPAVTLEQLIQQAVSVNTTSMHNATFGNSSNITLERGNASAQEECVLQIQNVSFDCSNLFNVTINTTTPIWYEPNPVQIIPGSNLYVAVWICLLASLNLAFRWKAQQALQFAQAQQEQAFAFPHNKDEGAPDGAETRNGQDNDRDDDGDDDMEQFDDD
jgi:hypothetical protein